MRASSSPLPLAGEGPGERAAVSRCVVPCYTPPHPALSPMRGEGNTVDLSYGCASSFSPGFTYMEFFGCDSTLRTIGSKNDSGSVS